MKVADILRTKGSEVITIDGESTVYGAVKRLVEKNIGALVVVEPNGEVAGIITERDVLKECNQRFEALDETKVKEVMTARVIATRPDDAIDYVQALMTRNRIRHLPVLSDGKLMGMVSIGDVNKILQGEKEAENRDLKDYIVGKYM
jgi:CBS domain-containing protein